ncbi:MAG: histidine phosphatase family protein [Planctomycetota bacterium]|nr:histidine phosphatase family protein [Planctomycetota bacterium]
MRLYLVRHGKAEKKSPTGRDEDRPLQPRGERQSRWLGETLTGGARADAPRLILASPALRASETARIIQSIVGCTLRVEPALQIGEPAEEILDIIARTAETGDDAPLMLIGHNPTMEILIPALVPGLDGEQCEMRTGMAAIIDVPDAGRIESRSRLIGRVRYPD